VVTDNAGKIGIFVQLTRLASGPWAGCRHRWRNRGTAWA